MGKGSTRRKEDIEKIWSNWDAIFRKEKSEEETKSQEESPKDEAND